MNNLYVFAIGGSGERVVRSLIMLLAAGVKIKANSVTPIFVDNDKNSAALERCKNLIKYYNSGMSGGWAGISTLCHELPEAERPSFFQTKINEPVLLDIAGESVGNLETIIGNLSKEDPIERLILEERDLLFSKEDLEMPLTVGFVGNPNIGSIVLNSLSFRDSKFMNILQTATQGDGVIVVGSLFGGTGAAGIPLIVNNFKSQDRNRATIGSIAVLPYFDFNTDDGYSKNEKIINTDKYDVNSDSFSTKTRAALMYYDDYMSKQMDYCYYIGDDNRAHYEHFVGGEKQDNPVHVVELLGAMSIIDFAEGEPQQHIIYKEPQWGLKDDNGGAATSASLSSVLMPEVKKAMVKFQLMKEFFTNEGVGFLAKAISENSRFTTDIAFQEEMRKACVGRKTDPIKDIKLLNKTVEDEAKNFRPAWGLNAFFKEWESWFDDLATTGPRHFEIFNQNASVTDANVTSNFFNDGEYGIAKVVTKSKGIFTKTKYDEAVTPEIYEFVAKAHSASPSSNVELNLKLPRILKLLSNALDAVIAEKTSL